VFEKKTSLLHLLDLSQRAEGVQIYIGGESNLVPLDEMSIVTAPYTVDGQVIGTLGVIGPTRMAYERVIPIVDVTAKLCVQRADAAEERRMVAQRTPPCRLDRRPIGPTDAHRAEPRTREGRCRPRGAA
jgi:hypothetical protein